MDKGLTRIEEMLKALDHLSKDDSKDDQWIWWPAYDKLSDWLEEGRDLLHGFSGEINLEGLLDWHVKIVRWMTGPYREEG